MQQGRPAHNPPATSAGLRTILRNSRHCSALGKAEGRRCAHARVKGATRGDAGNQGRGDWLRSSRAGWQHDLGGQGAPTLTSPQNSTNAATRSQLQRHGIIRP
jgi:hypothetical protein